MPGVSGAMVCGVLLRVLVLWGVFLASISSSLGLSGPSGFGPCRVVRVHIAWLSVAWKVGSHKAPSCSFFVNNLPPLPEVFWAPSPNPASHVPPLRPPPPQTRGPGGPGGWSVAGGLGEVFVEMLSSLGPGLVVAFRTPQLQKAGRASGPGREQTAWALWLFGVFFQLYIQTYIYIYIYTHMYIHICMYMYIYIYKTR